MHSTTPARVIRLRKDRFDERARELGLSSNTACAEYIGIDRTTLGRIREGEVMPGERFIAACMSSGFTQSFDGLFVLGEAP